MLRMVNVSQRGIAHRLQQCTYIKRTSTFAGDASTEKCSGPLDFAGILRTDGKTTEARKRCRFHEPHHHRLIPSRIIAGAKPYRRRRETLQTFTHNRCFSSAQLCYHGVHIA